MSISLGIGVILDVGGVVAVATGVDLGIRVTFRVGVTSKSASRV